MKNLGNWKTIDKLLSIQKSKYYFLIVHYDHANKKFVNEYIGDLEGCQGRVVFGAFNYFQKLQEIKK